jgi:hypothetical protein
MDMKKSDDVQAQLLRVEKTWKAKLPIFRQAALLRELAAGRMLPPGPARSWFTELADDTHLLLGESDLHTVLMWWVVSQLREISSTSNWFRLSEALAYKLAATDLRGAVCGDIKLPLSSFYIELPEGMLFLEDAVTGWHTVRSMVVTKGAITERTVECARRQGDVGADTVVLGPRLLIECYGEPNENSRNPFDDVWIFMSYRLLGDEVPVEEAITASILDHEKEAQQQRGKLGERELNGVELRKVLLHLVLNLCVYLGSEKARVEHVHAEEIKRLHKNKKGKQLRKTAREKVRRLQNDRVFVVGSDVVVDLELREYVRTEGTGAFRLAYRTLVRGHWRNQAHGPQRSLRTRRWIEPHVRGAELPTEVVGHVYHMA